MKPEGNMVSLAEEWDLMRKSGISTTENLDQWLLQYGFKQQIKVHFFSFETLKMVDLINYHQN
jgi:hypothetical protein